MYKLKNLINLFLIALLISIVITFVTRNENYFSNYPVHIQIECEETALRMALDSVSSMKGGMITFTSQQDTIDISDRIYFYGNNLVLDGEERELVLRYTGPDDCSQKEGQDHFIEIHGDNNVVRNFTLLGFPDGMHIQRGNNNLVENLKFPYICEDAVTNNGRGFEAFKTIIRGCYFAEAEDKAVMINNGGSAVIESCEFVNCAQPVRAGGKCGEYVIKDCTFRGVSTGPRFSGGAEGMRIFFQKNTVEDAKYGIRVYGEVEALIQNNTIRSVQYGLYAYQKAKIRMENNIIQGSTGIGILLEDSVQADLGGGLVPLCGDTVSSAGMNVIKENKIKDLVNKTPFTVKAVNNSWDHQTRTDVLTEDVQGSVTIE